jgi:hypothetical protein
MRAKRRKGALEVTGNQGIRSLKCRIIGKKVKGQGVQTPQPLLHPSWADGYQRDHAVEIETSAHRLPEYPSGW